MWPLRGTRASTWSPDTRGKGQSRPSLWCQVRVQLHGPVPLSKTNSWCSPWSLLLVKSPNFGRWQVPVQALAKITVAYEEGVWPVADKCWKGGFWDLHPFLKNFSKVIEEQGFNLCSMSVFEYAILVFKTPILKPIFTVYSSFEKAH